jgi:hypothetical protein
MRDLDRLGMRQSFPQGVLILTLAFPLLIRLLHPETPSEWMLNDMARSVNFAILAGWCLSVIPYIRLREKCIAAAVMGYAVADVFIHAFWYALAWRNYLLAILIQTLCMVGMAIWYIVRSYDDDGQSPEIGHVYCLRKRPTSPQDFVIALFSRYGSYAIYCNGDVYRFRHGALTRSPFDPRLYSGWHMTRGWRRRDIDVSELNALVGLKWGGIRHNCLTILGAFWWRNL